MDQPATGRIHHDRKRSESVLRHSTGGCRFKEEEAGACRSGAAAGPAGDGGGSGARSEAYGGRGGGKKVFWRAPLDKPQRTAGARIRIPKSVEATDETNSDLGEFLRELYWNVVVPAVCEAAAKHKDLSFGGARFEQELYHPAVVACKGPCSPMHVDESDGDGPGEFIINIHTGESVLLLLHPMGKTLAPREQKIGALKLHVDEVFIMAGVARHFFGHEHIGLHVPPWEMQYKTFEEASTAAEPGEGVRLVFQFRVKKVDNAWQQEEALLLKQYEEEDDLSDDVSANEEAVVSPKPEGGAEREPRTRQAKAKALARLKQKPQTVSTSSKPAAQSREKKGRKRKESRPAKPLAKRKVDTTHPKMSRFKIIFSQHASLNMHTHAHTRIRIHAMVPPSEARHCGPDDNDNQDTKQRASCQYACLVRRAKHDAGKPYLAHHDKAGIQLCARATHWTGRVASEARKHVLPTSQAERRCLGSDSCRAGSGQTAKPGFIGSIESVAICDCGLSRYRRFIHVSGQRRRCSVAVSRRVPHA